MSSKKQAKEPSSVSKFFGDLANRTSLAAGRASTFIVAASVVLCGLSAARSSASPTRGSSSLIPARPS